MNTIKNNALPIAIALLIGAGLVAYAYLNTDIFENFGAQEETASPSDKILNEQRKQFIDERGYFSLLVPQSWSISTPQPAEGVLSSVIATTPNFATNETGGIAAGGSLRIDARSSAPTPLSEEGLLEQFTARMGTETIPLWVYRAPEGNGHILISQMQRENVHYDISFRYNTGSYPEGERMFVDLLRAMALTPQN